MRYLLLVLCFFGIHLCWFEEIDRRQCLSCLKILDQKDGKWVSKSYFH
jgi:hypothetical protein